MRNRQILNFEHFELFFARFYSVKRAFSTKWWPSEENAPKIIFFAFLVYFYINTKYIKLDRNSENFLIFWCTLLHIPCISGKCCPLSSPKVGAGSLWQMPAPRIFHFNKSHATVAVGAGDGAGGHPLTSLRRIYFTNTLPVLCQDFRSS